MCTTNTSRCSLLFTVISVLKEQSNISGNNSLAQILEKHLLSNYSLRFYDANSTRDGVALAQAEPSRVGRLHSGLIKRRQVYSHQPAN